MAGILVFAYGLICYLIFFATFLYAVGFVGNMVVPKSVDGPPAESLSQALFINIVLLGIFGLQHSIMARPGFKRAWQRIIPEPIERSTFVLFSSLALILLFWQWRPIDGFAWNIENEALRIVFWAVFFIGWGMVLLSTFLINHFDLFGLRQVYLYLKGSEYQPIGFRTPMLYKLVRHPIMLGFIIAFWATPTMSGGHLLFAVVTTAYILVAIQFEERDIMKVHGPDYEKYRKQVSMILPMPKQGK